MPIRAATLRLILIVATMVGRPAGADEIVLPEQVFERHRQIEAAYRLERPGTGAGILAIEWSDAYGRIVDRQQTRFELHGGSDVTFPLDLRRAASMRNELRGHLSFDGRDERGNAEHRESNAAIAFTARPAAPPWSDYRVIMWQRQTTGQYAALRRLGIGAGMVGANRVGEPSDNIEARIAPLLRADLAWYVENIATDFYSPYHRWFPDRPVNWRFAEAKELYRRDPAGNAAFIRDPGLSDPTWLARIRDRLVKTVRAFAPYRPLYYNLGDEPGIADLSAFWDFDLSEQSLSGMRTWLAEQYGSLPALNRQWGTQFRDWESVRPMATREALRRADDNFSAWADFKEWMDVAFARALRAGTDAVHSADSAAYAAIEGAQIAGWGGYDYARLAGTVDLMEIYDLDGNLDIVRSLDPTMVLLTTSAVAGPREAHRLWRGLFRGIRGAILWDDKHEFLAEDGSPGMRGLQSTGVLNELGAGLGALLINSRRVVDPVAILYSPASLRMRWLLDRRQQGDDWAARDADTENQDNAVRSATRGFSRLIQRLGLQPAFIAPDSVASGALHRNGTRILILPHAIALSPAEAAAIRRFVAGGGTVIAESEPGLFDHHGRRVETPLLADLFRDRPARTPRRFAFGKGKAIYLDPDGAKADAATSQIFRAAGATPSVAVTRATGEAAIDVEIHAFQNGAVSIVTLQRELSAESSTEATRRDESVVVTLPRAAFAYDLRARREWGRVRQVTLALGAFEPVILALSSASLKPPALTGPRRLRPGEIAEFQLGSPRPSPGAFDILHVDIINPDGSTVPHYSGNSLAPGGTAAKRLPLAFNDPVGTWQIRVTDLLSGQSTTARLEVAE